MKKLQEILDRAERGLDSNQLGTLVSSTKDCLILARSLQTALEALEFYADTTNWDKNVADGAFDCIRKSDVKTSGGEHACNAIDAIRKEMGE